MKAGWWAEQYATVLSELPIVVEGLPLTICGLGTCVDAYVRLAKATALFESDVPTEAAQLAAELIHESARTAPTIRHGNNGADSDGIFLEVGKKREGTGAATDSHYAPPGERVSKAMISWQSTAPTAHFRFLILDPIETPPRSC